MNASKVLFFSITILALSLFALQTGNIFYWGMDSLSKMSPLGVGITVILDILFLGYIAVSLVSGLKPPDETQAG